MLYTINKQNTRYQGGQTPIVYLVTTVAAIADAGLLFVFTDGHPVMAYSSFFDFLEAMVEVDWEIMEAKYWADTEDDPDRKRRRQAEFLVYQRVPWKLITEIGVINESVKEQVCQVLRTFEISTPVRVYRNWYYQT